MKKSRNDDEEAESMPGLLDVNTDSESSDSESSDSDFLAHMMILTLTPTLRIDDEGNLIASDVINLLTKF